MNFALSMLSEWKSIDFQQLSMVELWLLAMLGVVLVRGIKLPPVRALLVLLLFAMSLQHARNGDLLAFIAPLLAAPWAGPQLAPAGMGPRRDWLGRVTRAARRAGLG